MGKALDVSRQAADYRLRKLREQGRIESKKIGPSLVWTVAAESGHNTAASDVERESSTTETPAWEREIEAIETPGNETQKAKREDALREAYRYLILNETAQKSDFKELLGDDVGYEGGFNSWWKNYATGKDTLRKLPNVDAPEEGGHTWHYVTEDA